MTMETPKVASRAATGGAFESGRTAKPATLDHLVYATPRLDHTVDEFTELTGVRPAEGGSHVGLGTRNFLVSLGGRRYLELIGPDPDQPAPVRPRPFDIDALTGASVITWAISPSDFDGTVARARERGYDPGEVHPMSRRTPAGDLLSWRLTLAEDRQLPGLVPFLIDWGTATHPTAAGLPETPLLDLTVRSPRPAQTEAPLSALGIDLPVEQGPRGISFTVDTPRGPVSFS